MSESSFYPRLAAALRWGDSDLVTTIHTIALQEVTTGLGTVLRRLPHGSTARGTIVETISGLPDNALVRFLTTPEVYFNLRHSHDTIDAVSTFLADCLDAEQRLAGLDAKQLVPVWSGTGDWYFPGATTRHDFRSDADPLDWTPNAVHRAPRLVNGVPVDFNSPFRKGKLRDVSGDDAYQSRWERKAILEKMDAAVAALNDVSPSAALMVAQLSRVIVPRKDRGADRGFSSTSTRICPGRIIIRNADLPEATSEDLIDGLVHETIHCVIDVLEMREPLIIDERPCASRVVASPWTKRGLDVDTYLQACFVWFGLWNLWLQAMNTESLAPRSVLRCLGACARGFLAADVVSPLRDIDSLLAPRLLPVVEEMQSAVRDDVALVGRALNLDGS